MAGVTVNGFDRKVFQTIFEELGELEKQTIDPQLDVTTNSVAGQFNAITARQLSQVWEALQVIYNSFNPDAAEGVALDNICKITGLSRLNATYSTTVLEIEFEFPGTTIETDIFFVVSDDNPNIRFTPQSNYTSPAGTYPLKVQIPFRSENRGSISLDPDANIETISTPTFGVTSVGPVPGELINIGQNVESDIAYRQRRIDSLAISGSSTIDAIRADLLSLTDNLIDENSGAVRSCAVYEATTNATPEVEEAHSIKIVIEDTGGNAVWNSIIANTIWNAKPAGIGTIGSISESITDFSGTDHLVYFERVQPSPMVLTYTVVYKGDLPSAADLKQFISSRLNNKYGVGEEVIALYVEATPLEYSDNIIDVTSFTINGGISDINIAFNETASFDVDDITINFVQG